MLRKKATPALQTPATVLSGASIYHHLNPCLNGSFNVGIDIFLCTTKYYPGLQQRAEESWLKI
jgi:hypothetical protein